MREKKEKEREIKYGKDKITIYLTLKRKYECIHDLFYFEFFLET